MRTVVFCLVLLIPISAIAEHSSEAVAPVVTEMDGQAAIYGEPWGESKGTVSIGEAIAGIDQYADEEGVFSGRITQVCQKKGCWMILADGERYARVDFNDHAFFIPKDASGPAQVRGVLHAATLDEGEREHLKEDGAEDVPADVYEIVATSVRIGA